MSYGTDTYGYFSIMFFFLFFSLTPLIEGLTTFQNLATLYEALIIFFEAFITPFEAVTNPC